jgi:hypothetical protein
MTGFIYIWRDKGRTRYYIGFHWGNENDGYVCSSNWMKKSKEKRPDDFRRKIIEINIENRKLLFERELYWLSMIKFEEIKPFNTNPKYYNLHIRNNEHWLKYPDQIKTIGQKISLKKTGVSTGPCSPEKAAKISAATTGVKKTYTPETMQSLIKSRTSREVSEETRQKISESGMGKHKYWEGKTMSEESNRKRSETSKGKCYTQPTKESRKAQSDARKALWADPEYRAKMTAIRQARPKKILTNFLS